MFSIDLTDHTLPGDLTPIVLVDMRLRAPLRTMARVHDMLAGRPVPDEERHAILEVAGQLRALVAAAIASHDMVAAHLGPLTPEPAEAPPTPDGHGGPSGQRTQEPPPPLPQETQPSEPPQEPPQQKARKRA